MFYDYVELEDQTQIAYSNVLADGTVEVSVDCPHSHAQNIGFWDIIQMFVLSPHGYRDKQTHWITS